jgi:hypothetical protein
VDWERAERRQQVRVEHLAVIAESRALQSALELAVAQPVLRDVAEGPVWTMGAANRLIMLTTYPIELYDQRPSRSGTPWRVDRAGASASRPRGATLP